MLKANLNDLVSVESVYPRSAFDEDAARNAQSSAPVVHGIKILSQPDAEGSFNLHRAAQQVGEHDADGHSIFLVPRKERSGEADDGGTYGASLAPPARGAEQDLADYRAFIGTIVEAARGAHFRPAIGRDEERLKGFRGG